MMFEMNGQRIKFIQYLIEVFNTRLDLKFAKSDEIWYTEFRNGKIEYRIEILDFKIGELKCCDIQFGISNNNQFIINLLKTSRNATGVFGIVRNAVFEWLQKHPTDVIIFAAMKDRDFSSRASLYHLIASNTAKKFGYGYEKYDDINGQYYIILKDTLSKSQLKSIKKAISGENYRKKQ